MAELEKQMPSVLHSPLSHIVSAPSHAAFGDKIETASDCGGERLPEESSAVKVTVRGPYALSESVYGSVAASWGLLMY